MGKINYVRSLLKEYGAVGLVIKFIEKRENPIDRAYRRNYEDCRLREEDITEQRKQSERFPFRPLVSIVVPTYCTGESVLREMIESVLEQTYDNWELILADGSDGLASDAPSDGSDILASGAPSDGGDILASGEASDGGDAGLEGVPRIQAIAESYGCDRICYHRLERNLGISANTNEGLRHAKGDYIALLDHDDLLAPNALYEMVKCVNHHREQSVLPLMLYSDEDKITEDSSLHFEPHFKPDYNEELLNQYNYICHFLMVHKSVLVQVGMLDSAYDGAQDYDFVLRCTEALAQNRIAHVDKIVYHWRVSASSTAGYSGNKDYARIAQQKAVDAHQARMGVNSYSGESNYIICQGSDIQPLDLEWDRELASLFPGHKYPVGMVCGRLVRGRGFWTGRVVSCGYRICGDGDVKANFAGVRGFKKGYFQRAFVPQNVSAGSLDFCVIDRTAFERVGGYDESLPAPYRDMDFAFRLREAGYAVLLNPQVSAVCSGRYAPGENKEAASILRERWPGYIAEGDAFFHENICCDGYV